MRVKKDTKCCKDGDFQKHRMFRMLQPLLLLLLYEKPSYGYNLIERLGEIGLPDAHLDPGAIYKTLRQIQEEGLVKSDWNIKSVGIPTRIYNITPAGKKILHQWAVVIKKRRNFVENFLRRYEKLSKLNRSK
ncbi:MAG: helix-turn-helix transcriptional regulator [Planctomycetes bacterium]|nr:helix-turn-helix transcriptional regulator [Planctomycetota bacterium]